MERCKIGECLDGLHYGIIDKDGGCELFAAVYNAVTDCIDLIHALDNAVYGIEHCINNEADSFGMILNIANDSKAGLAHSRLINNV